MKKQLSFIQSHIENFGIFSKSIQLIFYKKKQLVYLYYKLYVNKNDSRKYKNFYKRNIDICLLIN